MSERENYELDINDSENFDLSSAEDIEQFEANFEEPSDMDLTFADTVNNSTTDFNSLYNRPSYNGEIMTNETNIEVDEELSPTSENPVQNRVIYADLATKADVADLAAVAFSGEYSDLQNEPTDFSQDEWDRLWKTY